MSLSYDQIIERLEQIETDLGERQNKYADSGTRFTRLNRDHEKEMAIRSLAASGDTVTERKQQAVKQISRLPMYEDFKEAEGEYVGHKAAVSVLETRASILQSLLRAETRLSPQAGSGQTFGGRRAA